LQPVVEVADSDAAGEATGHTDAAEEEKDEEEEEEENAGEHDEDEDTEEERDEATDVRETGAPVARWASACGRAARAYGE
jgi:hypothetical protein